MDGNTTVSGELKMGSGGKANAGWSWGGFMFSPAVIFASRRYIYLLLYILMFIPFVGWIIPMIVLGIKGRDLIMTSSAFSNTDEARGFMKGIDHAGKIMFFITLALIGLGIIFGLVVGFGFLGMFRDLSSGQGLIRLGQ